MGYKILQGHERDFLVQRDGVCACCGFTERSLIAWNDEDGVGGVRCVECMAPLSVGNDPLLEGVFLPEIQQSVFAHYVRVLAWFCYSALTGTVRGHDFSSGDLPADFVSTKGWETDLRWHTLSAGLEDMSADVTATADLQQAKQACAFLASRREFTVAEYGTADATKLSSTVDAASFERDFRLMRPGIGTARIRSWGQGPSTFKIIASRDRLLGRNKGK